MSAAMTQAPSDQKFTLDKQWETARFRAINMNKTPLVTVLLGLLTLSVLASVVLCWLYISNTRELRSLQSQAGIIGNNRAVVNAMANDVMEYAKKHPDIDPILVSVGLKPGSSNATTAPKPAAK